MFPSYLIASFDNAIPTFNPSIMAFLNNSSKSLRATSSVFHNKVSTK